MGCATIRGAGRHARLVLAVVLGALVGAGPLVASTAGAAGAIQPANQPTPIPGATNGELPASDLVRVAPGCLTARAAGPSLGLLLAEARERGTELGTAECYRSLQGEESAQAQWTSAGNSACAAPVTTSSTGQPTGTSMHGWGKAADFTGAGGASVAFGSPAYAFLKAFAGQTGWNHPGWAEPGGSACPEAWHWEWVGDGGTLGAPPVRADVVGMIESRSGAGYASVSGLGSLVARGDFVDHGSAAGVPINWLMVGAAPTPDGGGYWLVGADGGVFSYGDAPFAGSAADIALNQPIVAMAPTPDGGGYWLVASDGGVFTYGDARFFGSAAGLPLGGPIVGMAPTPDGGGYWLVGSDGGVMSYGDARFAGSTGGMRLNAPVVGMAATSDGGGYWLVASDGGIFTFGDAGFAGSMGGMPLNEPVVGMAPTPDGAGYRLVAADGGIFTFGDAGFAGAA